MKQRGNCVIGFWGAAAGTGFTFLLNALGASSVFVVRRQSPARLQRKMLGFAAGVMLAASVFSLLLPATEQAAALHQPQWLVVGVGLLLGIGLILGVEHFIHHQKIDWGGGHRRTFLLVLAITLHNIPEGMAVGLSFALAQDGGEFLAAAALAFGIGVQNFPEGAAIALPLVQEGTSKRRAFWIGAASGVVEPMFGLLMVWAAPWLRPFLPLLLATAAGAMLLVVVEELLPEAVSGEAPLPGTLATLFGFWVMMLLDVALG